MPDLNDTIAAEATPPGRGSVRIIRLSGTQAEPILRALFAPEGAAPWEAPRTLCLGDVGRRGGVVLDRALAVFFPAPGTFTGEDVVEFQLHGSPGVLRSVLDAAVEEGARPALPGEYSYRAFLNGKLTLVAAETINALVSAETEAQLERLGEGFKGGLESSLRALLDRVLELRASWEARVDFPEDVEGGPSLETK